MKIYRPDPIKVTERILRKIPSKFLAGLDEINFHDHSNDPVIKYVLGKNGKSASKIDIYMEGFSRNGSYSLFHYNFLLLPTISDHIVKYLQPISNDPEIQAVIRHRYNPKWVYMGPYSVFMAPLYLIRLLFNRVPVFRGWMNKFINNFLGNHSKGT